MAKVPSSDRGSSLDFLKKWCPEGPWVLTAIPHEKKNITAGTFGPGKESALLDWLELHGSDNIYFQVNPLLRPILKKAEREDVKNVSWLHIDVDPRAGEDLERERKRILASLMDPGGGVPRPTCIIFSGGGYQGFWRLTQPIEINGDLMAAEEAKRFNLQLEVQFGGDHCHNIDRIMRLPGTINWPDAKKKKKGRVAALASLVHWSDAVYEISQFVPAPKVEGSTGEHGFPNSPETKLSGNIQKLASIDDLPKEVSDYCRVVIVQGMDPDNPSKWPSRSEALFWVVCELVRANCTNDQIFAVLTDPEFLISGSVLEKGSRAERYALRQIERAREEAISPWLRRLNEEYAVIADVGGKCRIISEVIEVVGSGARPRISYISFNDFKNFYCNKKVEFKDGTGKVLEVPVGNWWVTHKNRREYRNVTFAPGHEVPNVYNLWRGFAFDARPSSKCDSFLEHVRRNICKGSDLIFDYVLGWMAHVVQKPAQPGHTAIVLRGRMGTGKGFFVRALGRLFGRHFLHVGDPKHLVGNFNAHLRDCLVLFADEAFYAGDKRHESILKMLITEETITVERKGVDAESASNFVHLLMASNDRWVVPAGLDERRFLVLDVADDQMQNAKYFQKISEELASGGYEALLHRLLTHDISKFDPRALPKTDALLEQKMLSFNTEQEWWFNKLMSGEIMEGAGWPSYVYTSALTFNFTNYCRLWNSSYRGNSTRLGRFLVEAFPPKHEARGQLTGIHEVVCEDGKPHAVERPRIYNLPTLERCRAHWDQNFGGPYEWPRMKEVEAEVQREAY